LKTGGNKDSRLDRNFSSFLRAKYSPIPKDDTEKVIDGIASTMALANDRNQTLRSVLDGVARMIYRLFEFKEIAIGLKSEKDGLFRYEILLGFKRESELAHRRIAYDEKDMMDTTEYPGVKLGKYSEYCTSEALEYERDDMETFNRPIIVTQVRKSHEEFLEGDYIDFYIYGYDKELIGWIEVGRTGDGKLPARSTVWYIELIASILAILIQKDRAKSKK